MGKFLRFHWATHKMGERPAKFAGACLRVTFKGGSLRSPAWSPQPLQLATPSRLEPRLWFILQWGNTWTFKKLVWMCKACCPHNSFCLFLGPEFKIICADFGFIFNSPYGSCVSLCMVQLAQVLSLCLFFLLSEFHQDEIPQGRHHTPAYWPAPATPPRETLPMSHNLDHRTILCQGA